MYYISCIISVGYPQADTIRETSNAADEMPPLAPPELPQIGDPTANIISPCKNASYMRYRCEQAFITY